MVSTRFAVVHFWAAWNPATNIKMRELLETGIPKALSRRVGFATLDVDPAEHHENLQTAQGLKRAVSRVLSRWSADSDNQRACHRRMISVSTL